MVHKTCAMDRRPRGKKRLKAHHRGSGLGRRDRRNQEISSQFGPALLFENIKGHRQTLCRRLFTNGTGTRERCAGCSEFRKNLVP